MQHYPNQLSGGQEQRVAIARAIVADPTFLLCDEPTGDLDRKAGDEILNLIDELVKTHGKTVLMVTHDPRILDLADRVLTVSGVSKSHAMTGFRIGVSAGASWLVSAMATLQSHASGNPSSISQAAAVAAFAGPQDFLVDWRERFRVRRDLAVAALNAVPGLSAPVPDGAFYCLVNAGPLMARFGNDEALALHLLDHGVAVVAASAFGGQEGFRISFAADDARLAEALSRIAKALI
jgi:aspartate/methionine/tyrosine aminotransferase